jgi:cyclopropane fatty-acyl-phospholipid synthase-like methyltransferase
MIKNIPCKNILDLGCGNGKLLRFIKDFKLYYGIDMDVNMLAKGCTKYSDENVIFNNIDLSKSWDQQGTKWNEPNPYISFDTITAINSLQHFCTDLFWEQLNIITHIGSVMVFNLVSMENNTKFEFDNSYIERIDSTIHYMYRAVHNKPMSEPYIESILSWLDKYGWGITSTYKPTEDLHSNYIWYVVSRRI